MNALFFVIASIATLGNGAVASVPTEQATHPAFQLWVETEMHYENRAGGPSSAAGMDLALGVTDHRITNSISNNCGFRAGYIKDFDSTADIGWRVEVTPTELTHEHAVVRLKWHRGIANGKRMLIDSHETSVLLRPGDKMRLDTFPMATRTESCTRPTATLLVSLRHKEPPRERVVSTDLWLVHRDASGKETIQQQTVRTNFGRPGGFYFDELNVGGIVLDVFGELTPRARPDGSITLALSTQREVFVQGKSQLESPNHSYVGTGGAALVFRPDDVVSFEIPMKPWPSLAGDSFTLRVRTRQIR
jgi:hypothetical protein